MGIQNYYDVNEPKKPNRMRLYVLLAVIILLLLGLGTVKLLQSDQGQRLLGTGVVAGIVVDESDRPVSAEIYVLGAGMITSHTDDNGMFMVQGVPSGQRSVVVAMNGGGNEYPVTIRTGQTTDMGKVKFMGTRVPSK